MEHRARRVGAALGIVLLGVALSACAADASLYPHGAQSGTFIDDAAGSDGSPRRALLLYVIVPLVLLLVIAAVVWLPGMVRGVRYRPRDGWSAEPVWFAGPPDPLPAVEQAQVGELVRGGAGGSW